MLNSGRTHQTTSTGLLLAAALCICLLCVPHSLATQLDEGTRGPDCSGPLGALLPECRSGTSMEVSDYIRRSSGAATVSPVVRSRDPRPDTPPAAPPAAEPPAPQPSTEFQRFAASSLGSLLPIYGANLFEHVPTTFAPLDRVPVTAEYVLGPGDEVLVKVWGQVNLDLQLTVDRAGAVYIPQAGNIAIAGLQFQQLGGYMRAQLAKVFRNFGMSVNMGQLRSIQIFVMGHDRRPGAYTVSSLSTLVNALFASGGPAALGSMRHIQLKRGHQAVVELDLYNLLQKGDKSKDCRLLPGDVVYIPPAGRQVAVAGSVNEPAVYELSREKTIGELIRIAGGLSPIADAQHATLERIDSRSSLRTMELTLDDRGLATPVEEGDILHISTIVPRFLNAVTLRGNVANPGRFPWHTGMKLREVIPDKESLVTREYWKKHNLLGFTPPAEDAPESNRRPARTVVETAAPEINWSYAVVERQSPRDLQTELLPFHLGKLVLENDERQNLELRPGD